MQDRSIVAPDLTTAMRWFVSNLDAMHSPFLVSTDHSPSEQIVGLEWHHSVLVISPNIEHQALADELGAILNTDTHKLKQWKKVKQPYKTAFHKAFFHCLKKYPVLVLATSIKESSALHYEAAFAHELGITGCYRRTEVGGKTKVEFGPFIYSETDEPQTLVVPENQAPMAIHLSSYMLRAHTSLQAALASRIGKDNVPVWFSVYSDKPPNDFTGPYAELMWLLLGGPTTAGKITWGGFTGSEDQPIDLLADNIAGFINDLKQRPEVYAYQGPPLEPPIYGTFYWEQLA